MKRSIRLAMAGGSFIAAIGAIGGTPAYAGVSPTLHLPPAACNAGTMNAHSRVPEAAGPGAPIFAHNAIPGTANVTPCGHGG